jgi:hypothetical protein
VTEFKVGDKVEHNGRRKGELTYGPFQSVSLSGEAFLLKEEDGRERVVRAGYLTALPSFAVGDEALYDGHRVKIEGGPVTGFTSGDVIYLFTFLEGPHTGSGASRNVERLKAITAPEPIKVGDTVRVLRDNAEFARVSAGDVFTVVELTGGRIAVDAPLRTDGGNRWYFDPESLEKVDQSATTHVYNGITYDLTATYRDRDGDHWKLRRDPANSSRVQAQMPPILESGWSGYDLATAVRTYGPLRKI